MGGEPSAIISDEQATIESAIKDLKDNGDYQGVHLHDTFHILRNISKKTSNKDLIRILRNAMFVKTDDEYKK